MSCRCRCALAAALCAAGAWAHAAEPVTAPVTIYAAGDIARCQHPDARFAGASDTAAIVAGGLAADPGAVVLTLGDSTYPVGAASEFANCYEPTWGRFKERTWPAPGNHEYYTPKAAPYFAYFGARAGKGYYSFELGSWHVVSLNSNLGPLEHAAQLAWLREDLELHPARCTLAYWHHPLFSSGWHGSIPTMRAAWDLLYRFGAEIVLSGHDHVYERFAPQDAKGSFDGEQGIRQFVVGTGGAFPTPFKWAIANSEVRDATGFGVLRLTLLDDGYEWQYVPAGQRPAGAQPDHGKASCH
ncbi:metallophosphoesterase family protein [Massilia horti]|uniref:Alkaline phosphatase n=1 Tax=Massilia horti TaxID=2562153 RepID=A0A4Y9T5W8_9BURK|nr:metallophosphoesterase [Massilia horti]TFW35759.1 alkaline phosphatase [Massilia horti]